MERVALPAPAFAATTSSPPNCVRTVIASNSSSVNFAPSTLENNGKIVIPACPPITVTSTSLGSTPILLATNVLARQTSNVVTPTSFLGLYTPAFLSTSAAMGTVELTGLLMTAIMASGQNSAHPSTRVFTILAFVLNKSSLVIPGLRGTPAGMTTTSAPVKASFKPPLDVSGQDTGAGNEPVVEDLVGMWDKSAATPGVPTIS
mmetsp:Transcript_1751/g.3175  ORF Transcript_1751/g.3175 Transcript_1751/m.3175 type:complete len:204 (-) Transcript_1751:225-836(-)